MALVSSAPAPVLAFFAGRARRPLHTAEIELLSDLPKTEVERIRDREDPRSCFSATGGVLKAGDRRFRARRARKPGDREEQHHTEGTERQGRLCASRGCGMTLHRCSSLQTSFCEPARFRHATAGRERSRYPSGRWNASNARGVKNGRLLRTSSGLSLARPLSSFRPASSPLDDLRSCRDRSRVNGDCRRNHLSSVVTTRPKADLGEGMRSSRIHFGKCAEPCDAGSRMAIVPRRGRILRTR